MHTKPNVRRAVAFAAFLLASVALAWFASAQGHAAHDRIEDRIDAGELVRLHIIANSDDDADQALKLKVRDALLERFTDELSGFDSADACFARVQQLVPDMEACARDTLIANGYDGPVVALTGLFDFPDRTYGGVFVPAGTYPALRVIIGAGEGHNWWCVMYPPLCFTGGDSLAVPSDVQFESTIAEWLHPAALAAEATATPEATSAPEVRATAVPGGTTGAQSATGTAGATSTQMPGTTSTQLPESTPMPTPTQIPGTTPMPTPVSTIPSTDTPTDGTANPPLGAPVALRATLPNCAYSPFLILSPDTRDLLAAMGIVIGYRPDGHVAALPDPAASMMPPAPTQTPQTMPSPSPGASPTPTPPPIPPYAHHQLPTNE